MHHAVGVSIGSPDRWLRTSQQLLGVSDRVLDDQHSKATQTRACCDSNKGCAANPAADRERYFVYAVLCSVAKSLDHLLT